MRRAMKVLLWVVAVLVLAAGILAISVPLLEERRHARVFDVNPAPVAYVSDAAAVDHGKYLFESRGCAHCHGNDGRGRMFVDDAAGGVRLKGPNITPAGVVAKYTERDWVLAIRHGLNPQRRALRVMPSEDWARMTDADLAAVVAYVRSLPPVRTDTDGAIVQFPFVPRALFAFGQIPTSADLIDHRLPPATAVAVAATVEHGAYVAQMCQGCHGPQLEGGRRPGTPPQWPPASRLRAGEGSVMPRYDTPEKFVAMLRSGKRPDGSAIQVMPFDVLGALNDTDAAALYAYLRQLPAAK